MIKEKLLILNKINYKSNKNFISDKELVLVVSRVIQEMSREIVVGGAQPGEKLAQIFNSYGLPAITCMLKKFYLVQSSFGMNRKLGPLKHAIREWLNANPDKGENVLYELNNYVYSPFDSVVRLVKIIAGTVCVKDSCTKKVFLNPLVDEKVKYLMFEELTEKNISINKVKRLSRVILNNITNKKFKIAVKELMREREGVDNKIKYKSGSRYKRNNGSKPKPYGVVAEIISLAQKQDWNSIFEKVESRPKLLREAIVLTDNTQNRKENVFLLKNVFSNTSGHFVKEQFQLLIKDARFKQFSNHLQYALFKSPFLELCCSVKDIESLQKKCNKRYDELLAKVIKDMKMK